MPQKLTDWLIGFVCLCVCLSHCLSVSLSLHLFINFPVVCLFVLFICFLNLFYYLSICIFIYAFVDWLNEWVNEWVSDDWSIDRLMMMIMIMSVARQRPFSEQCSADEGSHSCWSTVRSPSLPWQQSQLGRLRNDDTRLPDHDQVLTDGLLARRRTRADWTESGRSQAETETQVMSGRITRGRS